MKDVRELVKVKPPEWLKNDAGTAYSAFVPQTRTTYFVLKGSFADMWLLHVNGDGGACCQSSEAALKQAEGDHESRIYALLEAV